MIHINVQRDRDDVKADVPLPKVIVETSTDGAGWRTQYVIYADAGEIQRAPVGADEAVKRQRERAEDTARIFANGCRYAGADVRMTSFGYAL